MNAPRLAKLKRASVLGRFGQHLASAVLTGVLLVTLLAWGVSLAFLAIVASAPRWVLVSYGPVGLIAGQLIMLACLRHRTLGTLEIDLARVDPEGQLTRGSWRALGAELPPTPEELLERWQEQMRANASA